MLFNVHGICCSLISSYSSSLCPDCHCLAPADGSILSSALEDGDRALPVSLQDAAAKGVSPARAVNALCAVRPPRLFPCLIACARGFILKALRSLSVPSVFAFHCCQTRLYLSAAHDASRPRSFRIFGGLSEFLARKKIKK